MAEHFVQPPHWEWYILGYFFFAGLAGGLYVLATMLHLWGSPRDEETARVAFLTAFPLVVVCGILLTIDLGQPLRFWHMMINTTPGETGLNFKYWSPMSLGTWALLLFGIFSFVSFLGTLMRRGTGPIFEVIGSLVGFFLASYTGVLLSVSNQPVWSDSWALGGLFLASGLSGSAALLSLLARRVGGEWSEPRLQLAEQYFAVLEAVLIVIFLVTVAQAGTLAKTFSGIWLVLWILVFASLIPSLQGVLGGRRLQLASAGPGSVVTTGAAAGTSTVSAIIALAGVLLLRYVVIFSAQF
jgi:formate-dependent nitrite reductase membrane component NrfD